MSKEKVERNLIKIGEASRLLGVSVQTLRNWHESGELVPLYVSRGGRRFYSRKEINKFLKGKGDSSG